MEQNFSELFRYLKIIYKRRHLAIMIALLVASAVIAASYRLPRQYQVDSTVFIEESVIKNLVKGIAITTDMKDRISVLRQALLSRDLISKVLSDLDVDTTVSNPQELLALVASLQNRTQISVSRGEDLFTVSITDPNPAFAQDFVNKLVRMYVDESTAAKREETYGANRFLEEQLVLFKQKLDAIESTIIEFRRKQGVYLSIDEGTTLQQLRLYQQQIETLGLEISTLLARKNRLNQQLRSLDPTVALFSEQQTTDRLSVLETRLRQLLLSYTENYPEVVKLQAEITSLRNRGETPGDTGGSSRMTGVNPLYQDARQSIFEVEAELSSLGAKKSRLQELSSEKEKELQNIPEHAKELGVMVQERDSIRKIYEELLLRKGQSEVAKQMEISDRTTTFRIVDPAIFPTKPVSPNILKMLLMGIAMGIGAGLGVVLLLDMFSSSVKDSSQLEELGVEVLAVIPHITNPEELRRWKRLDRLAYSTAALWGVGFCGLLGFELFGR